MMLVLFDFLGRGSVTPLRLVTPEGMLLPPEAYKAHKAKAIDDLVAAGIAAQDEFEAQRVTKEQWPSISFYRCYKRETIDHRSVTYYAHIDAPKGEWEGILPFVGDRWISIAASAWEGFQLAGRGFLHVNFKQETTSFVPATAGPVLSPRDELWREIQRLCRNYTPETNVVLVFLSVVPNDEVIACIDYHTPSGWAAPPEAYQQVGVAKAGFQQT